MTRARQTHDVVRKQLRLGQVRELGETEHLPEDANALLEERVRVWGRARASVEHRAVRCEHAVRQQGASASPWRLAPSPPASLTACPRDRGNSGPVL